VNRMVKGEIRLKYSGFVLFACKIFSVATGAAFIIMITRNVSENEFGIWGNTIDILNYFILLAGILPFWTTRFVSRRYAGSAKTGFIANVAISIASAFIYLALIPFFLSALQISAYTNVY